MAVCFTVHCGAAPGGGTPVGPTPHQYTTPAYACSWLEHGSKAAAWHSHTVCCDRLSCSPVPGHHRLARAVGAPTPPPTLAPTPARHCKTPLMPASTWPWLAPNWTRSSCHPGRPLQEDSCIKPCGCGARSEPPCSLHTQSSGSVSHPLAKRQHGPHHPTAVRNTSAYRLATLLLSATLLLHPTRCTRCTAAPLFPGPLPTACPAPGPTMLLRPSESMLTPPGLRCSRPGPAAPPSNPQTSSGEGARWWHALGRAGAEALPQAVMGGAGPHPQPPMPPHTHPPTTLPQSPALAPICRANLMNTSSSVALATPQSSTCSCCLASPMAPNTAARLTSLVGSSNFRVPPTL